MVVITPTRLTLKELFALYPSCFTGWDIATRDYVLSVKGYATPVAQTEALITMELMTVYSAYQGWLTAKAQIQGLNVDLSLLMSEEIETFDTPDTDVSSEVPSSRTTYERAHVNEYSKYLSARLGMTINDVYDELEKLLSPMFATCVTLDAGWARL